MISKAIRSSSLSVSLDHMLAYDGCFCSLHLGTRLLHQTRIQQQRITVLIIIHVIIKIIIIVIIIMILIIIIIEFNCNKKYPISLTKIVEITYTIYQRLSKRRLYKKYVTRKKWGSTRAPSVPKSSAIISR